MDDPFDLLGKKNLEGLKAVLSANPSLARMRAAAGASLLAWAHYSGQPDATSIIRPHIGALDPYDAIIVGDIGAVREALDGGWDAGERAPDGFTPLALAAFFRQADIFDLLLPLFAAAILGGVGNVVGAVIGGLMIGLIESLSVLVVPAGYKMAIPFVVLLLVLFVRPSGLFRGTSGGR